MIIERTVSRMLRPDTMPTVIISVEEGTNCGNVEQILFNRKRKCIDSFDGYRWSIWCKRMY